MKTVITKVFRMRRVLMLNVPTLILYIRTFCQSESCPSTKSFNDKKRARERETKRENEIKVDI